jgi:hypothetical protein
MAERVGVHKPETDGHAFKCTDGRRGRQLRISCASTRLLRVCSGERLIYDFSRNLCRNRLSPLRGVKPPLISAAGSRWPSQPMRMCAAIRSSSTSGCRVGLYAGRSRPGRIFESVAIALLETLDQSPTLKAISIYKSEIWIKHCRQYALGKIPGK